MDYLTHTTYGLQLKEDNTMNTITTSAPKALKTLSLIALTFIGSIAFTSCDEDDEGMNPVTPTLDLTGTFQQEDAMGRPGITTALGGSDAVKNNYNVTAQNPTARGAFQPDFLNTLTAYHNAYGATYQTNLLNLSDTTLTTVLSSFDALQVAPEGTTTYFESQSLALTGRALTDDVIDVSLILFFGGPGGARFDGNNGTPQLVSDGVGVGDRQFSSSFPYMEAPLN